MKKALLSAGFVLCVLGFALAGWTGSAPGPDASLYDALARFHGHRCAGSLLGARMGFAAKAALGDKVGKGKLRAVYYAAACPLDGIQMTTGCTLGNGTIEAKGKEERRLVLSVDGVPGSVEATLTPEAAEQARVFKDLSKTAKGLPQRSPERQRAGERMEEILKALASAPEATLVIVSASQ
ncbi:MAG: formylmethanofuran dehydrogenase subunit E family protein [Deltaproteobacteria bacterium]|nr:formylmethanofuran dehydrogenase subunit E family protein [Deltaproteobacteria bacterium]